MFLLIRACDVNVSVLINGWRGDDAAFLLRFVLPYNGTSQRIYRIQISFGRTEVYAIMVKD